MADDTVITTEGDEPVEEIAIVGETEPVQPDSTPPSEPAAEPEPVDTTPAPEPTFRLPGQGEQPVNEADWLRQQYGTALQQMQQMQQQLQELQFKDLPEEDRAAALQQQQFQQMQQQLELIQQQQALKEWQSYWAQYLPDPTPVRQLVDPIQMGHHVATTLYKQAQEAKALLGKKDAEIAALKKAAGVPQPGPQVTTGAAGNAVRPTFRDLMKDPQRLERLYQRAQMGLLEDSEIPPIT